MNINIHTKVQYHSLWILLVFHLIGVFLFLMPERILGLSFLNILVCSLFVIFSAKDFKNELKVLAFIFLGGVLVEVVGVNTGLFFGEYEYGSELGPKLFGVPIVLGFNWYCVVAASAHLSKSIFKTDNYILLSLISATLCTTLDFVIEPVAMANDFWDWGIGYVPVFNYVCWFVFSFGFSLLYFRILKEINKTAVSLFFIWLIFFLLLNFI